MRKVILDTGPLVALLNRRDRYHRWAVARWNEVHPPLLTCESVISEASFLLAAAPGGGSAVLEMVHRRVLSLAFRLEDEATAVANLMTRYLDVPMSLADACLVRMTEQRADSAVLTLDRDFRLYRRHGRQIIPTLMPYAP